ncbi:Carboxylesterase [Calidithermus terrae]|uniref:Carboxylesterase n=1 Tax=Calidithermus terrae TaxID=1408545 RepID=A0A399EA91_9DEIN|nr:alpha/beta fold hydrolase [Calidithermus terrae]RIH78922.1 Carboxylesterase [Calidithermus terrae]
MGNVLVLHGFTSHPVLTLGPLPEALRRSGYTVLQPALPGHGTRPEDLAGVRWEDWYRVALEAYRSLPQPRAVVGLSMGGLLAAKLAAEEPTEALVALVPALGFVDRLAPFAPYLSWLIRRGKGTNSVLDPERRRNNPNYPYFPTKAFVEVLELARLVPGYLPRVKAPALVLQARHDSTVAEAAVRRYYELLGSASKEHKVYDSEHDLLLDSKADEVAADVAAWLLRVLPPQNRA